MEDINVPGPKRFKPNHSNSVLKGKLESTVASSNDIALLNTGNSKNGNAVTPLDEPQIKRQTSSAGNMANDPLQVNENCRDSITPTKKDQASPKPLFQSYPIAIDSIKIGTGPIFLRKVAKPPVTTLLKKIKPQNVITLQHGDKLISVQEVKKKHPRKSDSVDCIIQLEKPCFTLAVQKPHKDIGTANNETRSEGKKNEQTFLNKYKTDNVCVIKECPGNGTYFFKVPNDWRRISIWNYCLKYNPKVKYGDFICDQHFMKEDVEKRSNESLIGVLKPFAVPSYQKVLVGCCISQCINQTRNTRTMYPIPIWGNYQSWLHYMDDQKLKISKVHDLQQYRVCDRHFFKPIAKQWYQLKPTLYLPTSKEHYLNKLKDHLETQAVQDQNEFCTYFGCKLTKANSYFMFYKFPTEYDRAIKWIKACVRPDILKRTPIEIETFIRDSIGVCFQHKNAVEKNIRRNEMNSMKLNRLNNETSDPTDKVCQGKTDGDKSGGTQESEPTFIDLTEADANPSDSNQLTGEKCYHPSTDYCAFINCSTFKKDLVKKYRFPVDNELLAQWIEATAIPKKLSEDMIRTLFVCGKHFNKSQYTERGTLILSSVPAPHTEFVDSSTHEGNEHWIIKQKKTQKINTRSSSSSNEASKSTVKTAYKSRYDYSTIMSDRRPAVLDAMVAVAGPRVPRHDKGPVKIGMNGTDSVTLEKDECVVKDCKFTDNRLYSFPIQNRFNFINWIKAVENTSAITKSLYRAYLNKKICEGHFEERYKIGKESMLLNDAKPTLHLVSDSVEEEDQVKDTSIEWKECNSDICDADVPDSRDDVYLKGNAILHKNSIEFPNIKRELRFGKHCRKYGSYEQKFPYKLSQRARKSYKGRDSDAVRAGHKVQIHTAIIVDDDDQSENDAVQLLSRIIAENAMLAPKRGGWGDKRVVPTKKKNST